MSTSWLLEKTETDVNYLTIQNGYWDWTIDVHKAFRMSRREDAESLSEIVEDAERINEHEWVDED